MIAYEWSQEHPYVLEIDLDDAWEWDDARRAGRQIGHLLNAVDHDVVIAITIRSNFRLPLDGFAENMRALFSVNLHQRCSLIVFIVKAPLFRNLVHETISYYGCDGRPWLVTNSRTEAHHLIHKTLPPPVGC